MRTREKLRVAMLAPIAWRTPPNHYGPWEQVTSLITEGLVKEGVDVTLFATKDSVTTAQLRAVCPTGYENNKKLDQPVWLALHVSEVFEHADEFDIIHSHLDVLPLSYSRLVDTPLVTTIHGFPSLQSPIVYRKYNGQAFYVAISDANRHPDLTYVATVHHGINLNDFSFRADPDDYLIFFGRIHHDKGTAEAIEIARQAGCRLIIAGLIQDTAYYQEQVEQRLDGKNVVYEGNVGPEKRNELLSGARALLHPINFDEPFGLSVIEAMACGTPVIAFNRGSMPELIEEGVTGYLVPNVDEAVRAVEKLPELNREECRRRAERRFGVERMVADYLKVYAQILGR
ncbi:MAG: glycosyltransferase family 4 protein [Candidatus Andersenbacteria bacterium]